MAVLLALLASTVTALMLLIKQFEAKITPPTDPTQLATFQSRIDTFNLIFSMVLGIVGAVLFVYSTPNVFASDPALISSNPYVFAVVAGLISVLPGGASTTLLSAVLAWLGSKATPLLPSGVEVVQGTAKPVHRTLALWS